ncbi:hypothetical protein CLV92_101342 [Kineococcus xinjiangensis]|uniref:Uncharacterized protein n=1 Tax=Kineococcus xinjiangensis TaxID=512762 RepID=A0A2S6IWD6_9ACTN|nr:hypothetical protein [Kineococcus xinjiangensis]PPK98643.1 hypothetical protein CLV92_101342 [Kineococcus xinjiangensis]
MHRVIAWLLVLAGLGGLVAGALLATVLRPPPTLAAVADLGDPGVAVVSAPGVLELTGPRVRVTAVADGRDVFLGVARESEVREWLQDAHHSEVTGLTETGTGHVLGARTVPGREAADPRLADIWIAQSAAAGRATLDWPRRPGRYLVVAATDGVAPAPATVRMEWARTGAAAEHAAARPLATAGSAALLLGLALLLLRRPARPHRPLRAGQRRRPAVASGRTVIDVRDPAARRAGSTARGHRS